MIASDRENQFAPGKLWSLLDMLRINAVRYLNLGSLIADMTAYFSLRNSSKTDDERARDEDEMRNDMRQVLLLANDLQLKTAAALMAPRISDLPQTEREYNLLIECLYNELSTRLFLHVPSHRSEFYENDTLLSQGAKVAFPSADAELRLAGNCYAAGSATACVYHCMRALESGLKALADDVDVIAGVQNWQNVIDQIEAAIKAEGQKRNSPTKSARLQFLSEAAKEFSHFKDGWRNHVAHSRSVYGEAQALNVMNHVRSFFEALSRELKEVV